MKHVWQDRRTPQRYYYGLYKCNGLFRKRLICYFVSIREARATAAALGTGFTVRRMRRGAFKRPP
jgi:hypothetical protein